MTLVDKDGRKKYCPVCDRKTMHYSEPATDVNIRWWCANCE